MWSAMSNGGSASSTGKLEKRVDLIHFISCCGGVSHCQSVALAVRSLYGTAVESKGVVRRG